MNIFLSIECSGLLSNIIVIFDFKELGMLGEKIRQLRLAKGVRQEELGHRLGVSKQSVSNWENGNIMPSIEMLVRLADYFSVSTDFLLGRSEEERLDITGLTSRQIAHLRLIVDDLRERPTDKKASRFK